MASVRCDGFQSVCNHRYRFHYSLIGPEYAPVICFLHGFMGNRHAFDRVLPYLCDRLRCLTVDLPGHGHTQVYGGSDCYRMAPTATALIELLTQLQIPKCTLLGYSMGGRLALYLAVHYPHLFTTVILESASPGLKTQLERDLRLEQDLQLANELETMEFSAFLERWYCNPLFTSLRKHPDFEQLIAQRLTNTPLALAQSLRQLSTGRQPSLWPQLGTISLPLWLWVGELDPKFTQINTDILINCRMARFKIVAHGGHTLHFERPLAFANLIHEAMSDRLCPLEMS